MEIFSEKKTIPEFGSRLLTLLLLLLFILFLFYDLQIKSPFFFFFDRFHSPVENVASEKRKKKNYIINLMAVNRTNYYR